MKTLTLAPGLSLPLSAVTSTFGLLAVRGAGKSNTAAVMAEEMFDAGLPFVVVDPVGSWFGLRSGADGGKAGGLPIPIFGGKHGDLPLERGAGELLADLVAEKRLSCVLDLSGFASEGDKKAFLLAFARRLYLKNEDPLHLFLEEADDYIPQRPMRDEAQLLRAWENIVRRGRARGLGITLITQRSAAVAKMVLTQVETLFAMRTTGPQDIAAIEAWVKYHQVDGEVVRSLAGLAPGEAWVWSPQFLGLTKRVQIRRRRTFDSGATPKNVTADTARKPATLADVDLAQLQGRMAATIEKAKADDPKALRARIVELERAAAAVDKSAPRSGSVASQVVNAKPVEILTEADREKLERLRSLLWDVDEQAKKHLDDVATYLRGVVESSVDQLLTQHAHRTTLLVSKLRQAGVARILEKLDRVSAPRHDEPTRPPHVLGPASTPIRFTTERQSTRTPPRVNGTAILPAAGVAATTLGTSGAYRMLVALAQHAPDAVTASKLALLTGIARTGGTFRTYLGKLKTLGWVTGDAHALAITADGLQAVGTFSPLPTGPDLIAYWQQQLGTSGARAMFDAAVAAYPQALTKDELADRTGIAATGGTFRTYLGKLRTMELLERRAIRASDVLFEAGR